MKDATLSNRVRDLRIARGLTREQLAVKVPCSVPAIEVWEQHPEERTPSARLLPGLAEALGVPMTDVLGVDPITPERARKVVDAMGLGGEAA